MIVPANLLPEDDFVVISPQGDCPVCGRPYIEEHPAHPEMHDFSTFYVHKHPTEPGSWPDDVCKGGDAR